MELKEDVSRVKGNSQEKGDLIWKTAISWIWSKGGHSGICWRGRWMKPGFLELNNRKIVLPLIKKVPGDDQTTCTSSPFVLDGSPLHTDLFPLRTSYQFNTPNLQLKYLCFPHDLNCIGIPSKRPFEWCMICIQTWRGCRVKMCKQITGKCCISPSRIGMELKCISLESYEWALFDGIIASEFGMDLENGILGVNIWVLPKDRISDQKSIGLGMRIVAWL